MNVNLGVALVSTGCGLAKAMVDRNSNRCVGTRFDLDARGSLWK